MFYAYQGATELNISGRKLEKVLKLIAVNPNISPHQLFPSQLYKQKCRFTHFVNLQT